MSASKGTQSEVSKSEPEVHPSGDADVLAGDVRGVGRDEEGGDGRDLLVAARTAHRHTAAAQARQELLWEKSGGGLTGRASGHHKEM